MSNEKININQHISELLYSYDCVILPNFGGFISNYKPASLSEDGKNIIPPSKSISFNKNLSNNDGLLINFIAKKNNIEYNTAKQLVSDFVSNLFLKLDNNKTFVFDKIGDFVFDKALNLIFEPYNTENYLSDSFGLSTINFPVINSSVSKSIEQKGGLKKVLLSSTAKKLYFVLPIIVLLSIISVNTNILSNLLVSSSSISSIETGISNEKKSENIVERKIDSMTKKENALFYKEPEFVKPKEYDSLVIQFMEDESKNNIPKQEVSVPTETKKVIRKEKIDTKKPEIKEENKETITKGKFILVSGSYKIKKRANKRIKELKNKGFNPEIIKYKGGFRVSVASYNDKNFAKQESKKLKKNFEIKSWVTKR